MVLEAGTRYRHRNLALALSVVAVSASASSLDLTADGRHPARQSLQSRVVIPADRNHAIPLRVAATDQHLVVAGPGDTALFVYGRARGELLSTFGRDGSGPEEFRDITTLGTRRSRAGDEQVVWAFDAQLGRLTEMEIRRDGTLSVARTVTGRLAGQLLVLPLNASESVGLGAFVDRRLAIFDGAGTKIREIGELPLLGDGVPASVAQQILQPTAAVHPDGLRIAVGARYAGRVDIYSTIDGTWTPATVPNPFGARVNVGHNGAMFVFRSDAQTRFGYISVAATRSNVYALYSGRTRQAFPGRANFGRTVHVLSWFGQHARTFDLDRDVIDIAISPDGHTLYAVAHEPSPEILAFQLPF